jgi:hypothetical protein
LTLFNHPEVRALGARVDIFGTLKYCRFHTEASQARPGRILVTNRKGGIEAWKAKRRRKIVSMSCSNSRVDRRGVGKSKETSGREF